MPEPGDRAPDFTLPNQYGQEVTLSELHGPIVLYFYPKAFTPGCTAQACGLREHEDDYRSAAATVVGVSPDPVERLRRFGEEHDLAYPLLSDADHAVAEAYGVWVEKSMYGRTFWGVQRTTFVIDVEGVVREVLRKVKPAEHDERALAALEALAPAA